MEAIPIANSTHSLYCDTSTGTQRPIVPLSWHRTVFDSLHGLSHPGIRATQKLITSRLVWPGINSDVCWGPVHVYRVNVLRYKSHSHSPPSTFSTPDARFDIIHIDIIEPLSPSHDFLTCVDHFTRWPEAIPLSSVTAETIAQALLSGWMSHFGDPSIHYY